MLKTFLITLLFTGAIGTGFIGGYGTKWWKDDVTARAAFDIRFDEAVEQISKQFKPMLISASNHQGTYDVVGYVTPTDGEYPVQVAMRDQQPKMIAVTESDWKSMVVGLKALQDMHPDVYAKAYEIGHAEGSFSLDW